MPGTCGSSKTLTHTLSLGESALNVVLTQSKSVACAEWIDTPTSTAAMKSRFIRISPHWLRRNASAPSYSDFGPAVFEFLHIARTNGFSRVISLSDLEDQKHTWAGAQVVDEIPRRPPF